MRETHKERKLRDQRRTGELENMGVDKYIKNEVRRESL